MEFSAEEDASIEITNNWAEDKVNSIKATGNTIEITNTWDKNKSNSIKMTEDLIEITNADSKVKITITADSLNIETEKDVNVESKGDCNVKGKNVKVEGDVEITGGSCKMKGAVGGNTTGPFLAVPGGACLFTGAKISGDEVKNT